MASRAKDNEKQENNGGKRKKQIREKRNERER